MVIDETSNINLSVNEVAEKPWVFDLSWSFKVEKGLTSVAYREGL